MSSSYLFQISSILYLALIIVIYFSKKKIKSVENDVYKYLIFVNSIILIVDIISVYFIYHMDTYPILNLIFGKLYLILLILWEVILTTYVFVISVTEKNSIVEEKNKAKFLSTIIFIICFISILILPLDFVSTSDVAYSSGSAAIFTYIATGVIMIIWLFRMFSRFKIIKKQKYLPLLIYVAMMLLGAIIQFLFPQLLVVSSVITYVTCIMYFTIENPDLKLIRELDLARLQAEKANHAKTDFLSSMSHEIRTPLNAILGLSQGLKSQKLTAEALEDVNDIIDASNSLLEIVNGILDISKIEAQKMELVSVQYDIHQMIDELTALTKVRIGTKNLEFKVSMDPNLPKFLYGDDVRIKQIILNLLTNAIKYTNRGTIKLEINCTNENDICHLKINVEDTGIGIKQENISKLFDKFERLDEKNSAIEGSGLGLAITKGLVDLMQGTITVNSTYHVGSTFSVTLDQKIVANPIIDKKEEIEIETQIYPNKSVVVVDDNNLNLKVIQRLLKNYDIDCILLSSGDELINLISKNMNYDLILLDDMMPQKTGKETLLELKKVSDFNIPVVVLTANAIEGMKDDYLDFGFDGYLAKPIIRQELEKILSKFLN